MAICKAYEHILGHLLNLATRSDENAGNKKTALDLYKHLTSYDTLVFIFLYNELAWIIPRYSQQLQTKDIQIHGMGRNIVSLCGGWNQIIHYTPHSLWRCLVPVCWMKLWK